MKRKSINQTAKAVALAALLMASATGFARAADVTVKPPPPPAPIPFFIVNDTSVSFTYYPTATNPGVAGSAGTVSGGIGGQRSVFARYSGEINHFDVWEYGTNLIHLEANQYGSQDPNGGIPGTVGQRELFSFARSTIGFNEVTHSKMFSNPLFTDVGLEVGGNFGINDDFLASDTTVGVVGLNFNLNLPGTVLVAILADKEFSHSSFASCGNVNNGVVNNPVFGGGLCSGAFAGQAFSGDRDFQWTWKVESIVSEPLKFLPDSWPVTFINILDVEGPKGTGISPANLIALGAFGGFCCGLPATQSNELRDTETKTEVFEDVRLSLDASKAFWGKPGIWDTYLGYRYWYNKFGTDHSAPLFSIVAPGSSVESSLYVGTTYHFK